MILLNKRDFVIVALMAFCLTTALFAFVPARISSGGEYDPWVDSNDDGQIFWQDLLAVLVNYGASGTPLTKASIEYDSGWVDITDNAGQYFNITHNLNSTDIIVDITGKTTIDGGVHQRHLGLTDYTSGWWRTYGGTNYDYAYSIVQTYDGGYALAGVTSSFGAGGSDAWLVKTDAFGNLEWNKTYGGINDDEARSVVQTGDGGYALLGTTRSLGDTTGDFWLVKVDQLGNEQWNKTYSKAPKYDWGNSMTYCSDGGFILAGHGDRFGSPWSQIWLIKTNSTGDKEWDYTYGENVGIISTYISSDRQVIETSDGGYAVIGHRFDIPTQYSVWFFKTDENGTMLWHKTYGTTNHNEAGKGLVETPDGGYAIAAYTESYGAGSWDSWLIKTNSTGDKEWDRTYGGTNGDYAYSIVQTYDGGYAIAGVTNSFGAGNYDTWLIRTDASGNHLWNKTYGGINHDDALSMVQTGDGGYALAGGTSSFGAGGYDGWLVKTEVESGLAWTDSTADTITLYRGATDPYWNYVRVRIWKIRETP